MSIFQALMAIFQALMPKFLKQMAENRTSTTRLTKKVDQKYWRLDKSGHFVLESFKDILLQQKMLPPKFTKPPKVDPL